MRVSHRHNTDLVGLTIKLNRVSQRLPWCIERDLRRNKPRHPHVDAHQIIRLVIEGNLPGSCPHLQHIPGGEPLVSHEAGKTARAIAALFDLPAIRIKDAIVKIGIRTTRRLDQQHLVTADAKTPIG